MKKILGMISFVTVAAVGVVLLKLVLVQLGWDLFMVEVFKVRSITILEALGLSLLMPINFNYNKK